MTNSDVQSVSIFYNKFKLIFYLHQTDILVLTNREKSQIAIFQPKKTQNQHQDPNKELTSSPINSFRNNKDSPLMNIFPIESIKIQKQIRIGKYSKEMRSKTVMENLIPKKNNQLKSEKRKFLREKLDTILHNYPNVINAPKNIKKV